MSEAPERIWAAPPYDDPEWKSGAGEWDVSEDWAASEITQYVRADRIDALKAHYEILWETNLRIGIERDTFKASIEALTAERDGLLRCVTDNHVALCRAEKAEAERDRLRAALAFYAIEENYKWYNAVDPCGCCSSWYEPKIHINGDDSGQIARAALKGETP